MTQQNITEKKQEIDAALIGFDRAYDFIERSSQRQPHRDKLDAAYGIAGRDIELTNYVTKLTKKPS